MSNFVVSFFDLFHLLYLLYLRSASCHQRGTSDCWYGHGYDPGDSDLKSDLTADRGTCRNESNPFRCHGDRKPCGWICHTSGRRQPVCGKFAYQCADDADRKEGNADDRIFHACTASDHIYSGNQSLSAFIRRAKT